MHIALIILAFFGVAAILVVVAAVRYLRYGDDHGGPKDKNYDFTCGTA